jgi:hypothetical protein
MQMINGRQPELLGWNITISPLQDGQSVIRMSRGWWFKQRRRWLATPADVAELESRLVERLAARRQARGPFGTSISLKMDFYGRQWLEVRRGWFGKNCIRLAPQQLARLSEALNIAA